jgi:hypothetical protein
MNKQELLNVLGAGALKEIKVLLYRDGVGDITHRIVDQVLKTG